MINSNFHNSDDAHENLYDGDEYCANSPKGIIFDWNSYESGDNKK